MKKKLYFQDLKSHPYFSDVDWRKVAEKKSDPPFEPNKIQIHLTNPINNARFSQSGLNSELEASFAKAFQSKLKR